LLPQGLCLDTRLKRLNASNNDIGDIGALQLASALNHNRSLREMILYHNHIADGGASAFAMYLRKCRHGKLVMLGLEHNCLSAHGKRMLMGAATARRDQAEAAALPVTPTPSRVILFV
jgi:Ran GTPase-activating protein (RanGAP) involved in mRNA processing and transport